MIPGRLFFYAGCPLIKSEKQEAPMALGVMRLMRANIVEDTPPMIATATTMNRKVRSHRGIDLGEKEIVYLTIQKNTKVHYSNN